MRDLALTAGDFVLAFDPGPHCGVVVFQDAKFAYSLVITDGTPDKREQYNRIIKLLVLWPVPTTTVVIEDFRSQVTLGREGADTLKLFGWIQGNAWQHGYQVVPQMPSVRTPFEYEAKRIIKEANHGVNNPLLAHEIAACAHGLAYIARTEGVQ